VEVPAWVWFTQGELAPTLITFTEFLTKAFIVAIFNSRNVKFGFIDLDLVLWDIYTMVRNNMIKLDFTMVLKWVVHPRW
jgi:hypothetical protein